MIGTVLDVTHSMLAEFKKLPGCVVLRKPFDFHELAQALADLTA